MICARRHPIASSTRRHCRHWLLATASLMAGSAASAADVEVGLSAGIDTGRVDCVASAPCDRRSNHVKLSAAYRLGETTDVQFTVFNAGKFDGGDTTPLGTEFGGTFKVSGVALSAGYRWDIAPQWRLRAHAGLASVRTSFDYINPVWGSASQSNVQPWVGLGLAYAVSPTLRLGLDADLTRFKVHTTRGPVRMLGLAAQFSF